MIKQLLSEFKTEIEGNIRLRIGLWLIIFIITLYCLILLHNYQQSLEKSHKQALNKLNKIEFIIQQDDWHQRLEKIQAVKTQLETQLWTATSQGLAQASLQAWLDDVVNKQINLPHAQIKIATAPMTNTLPEMKLLKVSARIEARLVGSKLESLLEKIASHKYMVLIEQLNVKKSYIKNVLPKVSIIVVAYFSIHS